MALPILETPTYELTLPSNGKQVRYRPFLVKEHKVLLTLADASEDEVSRMVKELVDACTFNKLQVSKLPHFDIEYIFLHLRAKSISEVVEVIVNCECGNKIETSYNIEDVKVEKEPDHSNIIQLTHNYSVEMNYPVFEDVVNVIGTDKTDDIVDLVAHSIKGVYSNDEYYDAQDQTEAELREFVETFTKSQFEKVEKFFTTSPRVVQTIESDCGECGKHNVTKLTGLQNFFV
jgi:hypothetical protein